MRLVGFIKQKVVAIVHLNSQPGERHRQWTECCRLISSSASDSVSGVPQVHPLALSYMHLCKSRVLPDVALSWGESSPDISKNIRLKSQVFLKWYIWYMCS